MVCPTCGLTDHIRATSAKCLKRKRKLREVNIADDEAVSVYNVKKGFQSFLCPLLDHETRTRLLDNVQKDVRDFSRLSIQMSYLVNFFFKRYVKHFGEDDGSFYNMFPKFDPLQFVYLLKTNARKVKLEDPLGVIEEFKRLNGGTMYDGKNRTYNFISVAEQYKTLLENNIQIHAFRRSKRYIHHMYGEKFNKTEIHRNSFDSFYKGHFSDNEIGHWFRDNHITEKAVKANFWKSITLFIQIQHELFAAKKRSFVVFPIYSKGLRHIQYHSNCVYELLRRSGVPCTFQQFREDKVGYWKKFFDVPKNFGYSFFTDGVAVSLSMNRIIPKSEKHKKKPRLGGENHTTKWDLGSFNKIIAVDPGAKTPIVTCSRSSDGEGFEYRTLTKGAVKYNTLEYFREKIRRKYTWKIDQEIERDRKSMEDEKGYILSVKSDKVHEYTDFQLKWFEKKQSAYERRKLHRLKFDKYIQDQKTYNQIVDDYFGKNTDTLVIYGAGYDFMNKAHFKGHRKFSHNKILKIIAQRKNLKLCEIDESYTTKTCSYCYEKDGISRILHVAKSPHRYAYCSICHKGRHRDKNAAKNILLKFEKTKTWPVPLLSTGADVA